MGFGYILVKICMIKLKISCPPSSSLLSSLPMLSKLTPLPSPLTGTLVRVVNPKIKQNGKILFLRGEFTKMRERREKGKSPDLEGRKGGENKGGKGGWERVRKKPQLRLRSVENGF